MRTFAALVIASLALGAPASAASRTDAVMATVGPAKLNVFEPAVPEESEVFVPAFLLQKRPVTNAEYLAFVQREPTWQRDRSLRLFADSRYLSHWKGPNLLGPDARPDGPVVNVSWFAAKAYCESQGWRLPTENEWELAAAAGPTGPRGADDPAWVEKLLAWYTRPTPARLPKVGQGRPNYWGLFDLDGLVWEWIYDFNARPPAQDDRAGSRFTCGGPPADPQDRLDYTKFMRFAFRSALKADYTASSLGFRCAADVPRKP